MPWSRGGAAAAKRRGGRDAVIPRRRVAETSVAATFRAETAARRRYVTERSRGIAHGAHVGGTLVRGPARPFLSVPGTLTNDHT